MDEYLPLLSTVTGFIMGFLTSIVKDSIILGKSHKKEIELVRIREKEAIKTKSISDLRRIESETLISLWSTLVTYFAMIYSMFSRLQISPIDGEKLIEGNAKKSQAVSTIHNELVSTLAKCEIITSKEIHELLSKTIVAGNKAITLYNLYFIVDSPITIQSTISKFYEQDYHLFEEIKNEIDGHLARLPEKIKLRLQSID